MINYINEKYKNNVVKNKTSKSFFYIEKIGCPLNFLRWSIKWPLVVQDRNHTNWWPLGVS